MVEPGSPSTEFEVVATASGQIEAEILRGMLEARGMLVWLRGESAGTALGLGVGPLAQIQVCVPESQSAEARQVLAEYGSDVVDDVSEDDYGKA